MTHTPLLAEIDALKQRLDARRPLSREELRGLATVFEAEETDYIHESNAIEGNTLTLAETEVVLRRGLTVHGKPLKDHLEAKNHLAAFQQLRQLVSANTALTESSLLNLHALILRSIEDEWAGRYRTVAVRISGSPRIPPNPLKVPALMAELFSWYASGPVGHPVEVAADLHLRLAQIHPFIDGNGRVCRLVMNLHLMQRGFPLTIIRAANIQRAAYYQALSADDESGSPSAFRFFVAQRVLESLKRYEEVLP
ncbi:Fic family protein [Nibricoccus sp. IMCC34717]|uniref:Fic family protein n=1 Tax=Nibricoccus sp. IMCC34717 TaxID=3034021 RepID=UPI00384C2039